LTAAQWNASVRDNILVTPAALATAAGRFFATTAANAIAERVPTGATVATSENTGSTSYTNLATVGPQVPVTTGTVALGIWACQMGNGTGGQNNFASVAVTGASSFVANDAYSARYQSYGGNARSRAASFHWWTGLTAGSNTFTLQYKVDAGTGTFLDRELFIIPF
jgi:hypothetical protein